MSKIFEIKSVSTETFYNIAERSFEASWKVMQDMASDNVSYLVYDADFMCVFIGNVIEHISKNFYIIIQCRLSGYFRYRCETFCSSEARGKSSPHGMEYHQPPEE